MKLFVWQLFVWQLFVWQLFVWQLFACCVLLNCTYAQELANAQGKGGLRNPLTIVAGENGRTVKSLEEWEEKRQEILSNMQEVMGELPDRTDLQDLEIRYEDAVEGDGFRRQTVQLKVEPNDFLKADLYLPTSALNDDSGQAGEDTLGKFPAVLALHPTGPLGKRIVAGEGPRPNRQYAVELARRGYIVLAPDYPSFGDYQYEFNSGDYLSGTMKGIYNHLRCVDFLVDHVPQVDKDRIGVLGHSLGGHNAIFAAAFDDRIQAVVTSCGWTPFPFYKGGDLTGWTSDRYMPLIQSKYHGDSNEVPFDLHEVIAALAPRPFFSSSPLEDDNFSVEGVKASVPLILGVYSMFDATGNVVVRYPECDHDFPTEIRQEAYAFLDQALSHTPVRGIDYSAELPRIPGKEPEEALRSLEVVDGFRIEQVAAEPLVTDPVAMSFDEDGRLFVVEMRDYSEQEHEQLGRVVVLTDSDEDGVFDESSVFAEDLSWPTAIICSQGGVFVGAAPEILFLRDNNDDGQADERRVVFTGFGRSNVQGLVNSFRWGLDNRIHGATSSSGGIVRRADAAEDTGIQLRGRDFSFDPIKLDLKAESGGAQHGMSFDNYGRKYVCSNSDHAQMVMYQDRDISRNPAYTMAGPRVRVADDGGQAPVFRISPVEPWRIVRTRLRVSGQVSGPVEGGGRPAGYFTGATGITVYRGDAWGEKELGTLIIGDVGSNIVHRKKVIANGLSISARRIDQEREFVRSTDVWFRPVQFANSPDGNLYVLDMYRETIEHPKSLPPEIKQHLDLTSGRDHGRLYRICSVNEAASGAERSERVFRLGDLSSAELVSYLGHSNAWHRETASRLLSERNDAEVVGLLEEKARTGENALGRIHAMSLLESQGKLSPEVISHLLEDADARVREATLRRTRWNPNIRQLGGQLAMMTDDEDAWVRYELAYTAGQLSQRDKIAILHQLCLRDGDDSWMRLAMASSINRGATELFSTLIEDKEFLARSHAPDCLGMVMEIVSRTESREAIEACVEQFVENVNDAGTVQEKVLEVVLNSNPSLRDRTSGGAVDRLASRVISRSREVAFDANATLEDRVRAINNLQLSHDPADASRLLGELNSSVPNRMKVAILDASSIIDFRQTAKAIVAHWVSWSPGFRQQAEEVLFRDARGAEILFDAIDAGDVSPATLSRVRLESVVRSGQPEVADRAKAILQRSPSSSRAQVIADYSEALDAGGNPALGQGVFVKHCAACHRLGGVGVEVGPHLGAMKNRGAQAILFNVLDPNREVNPQFVNYLAITEQGRTHTGLIADESATSLTLRRAEGIEDRIAVDEIDELTSTGTSLMPEGLEKVISVPEMKDLISYLLSVQ
ncbi:Alpha/beta hydrolase family protein [Thalassoglobus neptunius]|uniref:Alpha/beta hydrolase family protein n=1 Tax=Thalassoglobus neptunius TaxID=1938619 RepID=A0A5C5X3E2_9PLAN|nr:PVC-type heme-binding CxxCH protein [Thalassoglobus neptunius]TWT57544.1 Alpha/beta hydrolase family protein [Thalassoglobus neptunius]